MSAAVQIAAASAVLLALWPPGVAHRQPGRRARPAGPVCSPGGFAHSAVADGLGGRGGLGLAAAVRLRRSLVALVAAVAIGMLLVASPPLAAAIVVGSVAVIWGRRRRAAAADRQKLAAALPGSIDLCVVVLGAGGTVRDCVEAMARHGPPPVWAPATEAIERTARGERLDQALRWLQLELGPGFQPLTGALLLAREQGGSVGDLLMRLAVEAGASRRRLGELRARQLPVALLVPLVVCSLPAVIVGTIVPLAIVALRGLAER